MKALSFLFVFTTAVWSLSGASVQGDETVYELRVYTCEPGKLEALHTRFREHTMEIFARHGMENVAYWTPADEPEKDTTLVYVLRHKSREAAKESWDAFRNDPEWKQVAKASREAHGRILSKSPESTYLAATDYSPEIGPANPDGLYELRTYEAAEGKLEDLHARFREHTNELFEKHGMKPYAYWRPLDEPLSDNTMIYIIAHPNREFARAAWKAFGSDPNWQAARRKSEENGSLVIKGGVDSMYLEPTPYTPTR